MKPLFVILSGALLAFAVSSCQAEDDEITGVQTGNDSVEVNFTSNLGIDMQTRAVDDTWNDDDRIGISMKKTGLPLSPAAIYNGYSNVQYISDGSGNMTAASNAVYYPQNGDYVDFVAYYPYASGAGTVRSLNISFQQNEQERVDLMYSNNVTNVNRTNGNVTLNFKHMMSELVFVITVDPGAPGSPSGYTISPAGFRLTADFSLANGTFSNHSAPAAPGEFFGPFPQNNIAKLFVFPTIAGDSSANRHIDFNYFASNNNNYTRWTIPPETSYEGGYSYIYQLTILRGATRSTNGGNLIVDAKLIEKKKMDTEIREYNY